MGMISEAIQQCHEDFWDTDKQEIILGDGFTVRRMSGEEMFMDIYFAESVLLQKLHGTYREPVTRIFKLRESHNPKQAGDNKTSILWAGI